MQFLASGHPPKGHCSQSDGFASTLYDPGRDLHPLALCAKERNIETADLVSVRHRHLCLRPAFQPKRFAPNLAISNVTTLERAPRGLHVNLSGRRKFHGAKGGGSPPGLSHFEHVPSTIGYVVDSCAQSIQPLFKAATSRHRSGDLGNPSVRTLRSMSGPPNVCTLVVKAAASSLNTRTCRLPHSCAKNATANIHDRARMKSRFFTDCAHIPPPPEAGAKIGSSKASGPAGGDGSARTL